MEAISQYAGDGRALYNANPRRYGAGWQAFLLRQPAGSASKSLRKFNHIYDHVKPIRQRWFGCACCPPNIARVLTSPWSLHLHAACGWHNRINMYVVTAWKYRLKMARSKLRIGGNYPWHEQVKIAIDFLCNRYVTRWRYVCRTGALRQK